MAMSKNKPTEAELKELFEKEMKLKEEFEASQTPVEDSSILETAIDAGQGALQGVSMNAADEIVGGLNAVAQIGGGRKDSSFGDLLQEGAAPMRTAYEKAKERSPIATSVGEVTGAVVSPTSRLPFVGGMNPVLREGLEGIAQGIMSKNKKLTDFDGGDVGDTAVSGTIGAVSPVVVSGVKKGFSEGANVIRARALGAGVKEFGERGVKTRTQIAELLSKQNLFSGTNVKFNPGSMKFEPVTKSKAQLSDLDLPTPQRLLSRVTDAVSEIEKVKQAEFGALMDSRQVDPKDIKVFLDGAVNDYANSSPRLTQARIAGQKLADDLYETLMLKAGPGKNPTLKELDALKSQLYEYTTFGRSADELPDSQVLYQNMARQIKDLVSAKLGNPKFKELNEVQSNYLTARYDLSSRIESLNAQRNELQGSATDNLIRRGKQIITGEDSLRQAQARELMDKVPLMLRNGMGEAIQDTPGVMMRQRSNNGEPIPYGPQASYRGKSLLQEMGVTELPRDTNELWEMKELVFAKFLQESPENAPAIIGAAKKGKEQFAKNISFLINSPDPVTREVMGSMFQDSKYNMIDGQIMDPQMKMLAMDDTRNNDKLTSVQKAQLLNKIQKGEKLV